MRLLVVIGVLVAGYVRTSVGRQVAPRGEPACSLGRSTQRQRTQLAARGHTNVRSSTHAKARRIVGKLSAQPAQFGLCVFVCVCLFVCLRPSPASVDPPRVSCAQVGVRLVLDDGTGPQPVGVGFAGEVRWGPQVQSIPN